MKEDILNRLNNADIVIAVYSKNGPQTAIYAKDGLELRQIGLVQNLELKASVNNPFTQISIEFPGEIPGMSDHLKKSLKETSSLMAGKGCLIKSVDIKPIKVCAESIKICEKS